MRLDEVQCGWGWTNETCICDPRGGIFVSMEDKREYYSTHPDSKGRVRLVLINHEEMLRNVLRTAHPEKSADELQDLLNNLANDGSH